MTGLIVGIVYGLAAIGVYELAHIWGVAVAAIVLGAVALFAALLTWIAWRIGAHQPLLCTLLIMSMPPLIVAVIGGVIGALLIQVSIVVIEASGPHASATVQGIGLAVGAVLSIGVSVVAKAGERATPAAFARRFVWNRYSADFPAMPEEGPMLGAYRAVREGFTGDGDWGVGDTRDRLVAIRAGLFVTEGSVDSKPQAETGATGKSTRPTASAKKRGLKP
jgi:hypothetical protein